MIRTQLLDLEIRTAVTGVPGGWKFFAGSLGPDSMPFQVSVGPHPCFSDKIRRVGIGAQVLREHSRGVNTMPDELTQLMIKAIKTQIRDEANRPTFTWTDGLNQMTLGIWATGTDQHNQTYLCLGEPDEDMSEMTGNGGTIYLEGFKVEGVQHGSGNTTRFDLRKAGDEGEYQVWVSGDWRPENLATAPGREGPIEPDRIV